MRKWIGIGSALAFAAAVGVWALAPTKTDEGEVGYRAVKFSAEHQRKKLKGGVWYPSSAIGTPKIIGENKVFKGSEVKLGAKIDDGSYPLVVLSHGIGGDLRSLSWLANALASQGVIVAGVNHPYGTWRDFDLERAIKHWQRPKDISALIDVILADPKLKDRIDETRIIAAGFSYGGWTALSLAGAQNDQDGFISACESQREIGPQCDKILEDDVGVRNLNEATWNASYRDPRVSGAVSIDPGLVWGVNEESFKNLSSNTKIIGLGSETTRMIATNFDASGMADYLDKDMFVRLAPAVHFSAMPHCKPDGPAILRQENDDPICDEPEGGDRHKTHARIIEETLGVINAAG